MTGVAMMTKLPVSMYESPKANIEVKLADDDDEKEFAPETRARMRKVREKRSFSSAMAATTLKRDETRSEPT